MPRDYWRRGNGMLVIIIFSEIATVQGRAWTGDVEAECIFFMVQGYASG